MRGSGPNARKKENRDEYLALIPFLQFCAHDLAESQGLDTTQKLSVPGEILTAIESVNPD